MGSLNVTNNTLKSEAKILLVRDTPVEIQELLPELDINAEFIEAQFGTDALRKLMKHKFSLLLFDIQTSYQVCSETIQWVKQEEKNRFAPIIIIPDDINTLFSHLSPLNLETIDCVQKPLNPMLFQGKVKQYLQLYSNCMPLAEEASTASGLNFSGSEILLVEDNQTNRMIAEMMLDELGCKVTMAEDGEEAIALLEKQVFQLIFMDCNMPVMDGYEAARLLKDRMRQGDLNACPIIAFTANERKEDRKKCARAGMNDYISKPVSEEALIAVLSKWIA